MTFFILVYSFEKEITADMVGSVRVRSITENLIQMGHKVVIFTPQKRIYRKITASGNYRIVGVPFLDLSILRPISVYLSLSLALFLYAFRLKPDVVYIRIMSSFFPAVFARLTNASVIIEATGDITLDIKNRLKLSLMRISDKVNFHLSDKIITCTDTIRQMIVSRYGIDPGKISVIRSAADHQKFSPADREDCCRKLGLDPGYSYLIFIGTLYDYQNIELLIAAAPRLIKEFPRLRFLILGDGPRKASLRQAAAAAGVEGYFIFKKQVEHAQVPVYINASDICYCVILAKKWDASPVKLFEYFSCSKAAIVSDIAPLREVAQDTLNSLVIPPDDELALCSAVKKLLTDNELRDKIGRNGRQMVLDKHNWRQATEDTLEICNQLRKGR